MIPMKKTIKISVYIEDNRKKLTEMLLNDLITKEAF